MGLYMFVLIDNRDIVSKGYAGGFNREGVVLTGFMPDEFEDWVNTAASPDLMSVEAFLIGDCPLREAFPRIIRGRSRAPVIAINDGQSLEQTLELFAAGVDDVVRKPVHVRELLARVEAIRRRVEADQQKQAQIGPLRIFFDGRDPEIAGDAFILPRRERRILEYLASNRGKRVSKAQIFNAIYGLFDEDIQESVVESHVSKLRKKLAARLGFDPIESKRYLGYCMH